MAKFKYLVTKTQDNGEIWKHETVITANEKLDALDIVRQMYPPPEYDYKFIETC